MHELTVGGAKLKVYLEKEDNGVTQSGEGIYSNFEIGDLSTFYELISANYQEGNSYYIIFFLKI